MLFTKQDITDFIEAYSDFQIDYSDEAYPDLMKWLSNNPHILMVKHFSDFVPIYPESSFTVPWIEKGYRVRDIATYYRPLFRDHRGQWLLLSSIPNNSKEFWMFHSESTIPTLDDEIYNEEIFAFSKSFDEILVDLENAVKNPIPLNRSIISPTIWTPDTQLKERSSLEQSTHAILKSINEEKVNLSDIHWRIFEDIVAELLREQGMEVYRVRTSPQGGRDILARGQLIPGHQPLTIAIEVKQKAVVGRPEVELALHQNKEFPVLLFVTSGRFTAGVIEESMLPENQLRLFLKDGIAIRDLISHFWIKRR